MSNFRLIDRDTGFLMPPSVDEWLPERHLARFVVEVIAGLGLRATTGSYRGSGEASYHPQLLLGIIVHGCATGVFSSRKLERATYDSVAFRFIAANEHPDHDAIAAFRRRFLQQIGTLFVQVLGVAREMGAPKMGTVALDGTKIHANASRHSALSHERAGKIEAQLQAEVADLMAKAEAADQAGVPDGMSIPEELARRERRLAAIARARATIGARATGRPARAGRARSQARGARGQDRGHRQDATREAAGAAGRGAAAHRPGQSDRRGVAHHAGAGRRVRAVYNAQAVVAAGGSGKGPAGVSRWKAAGGSLLVIAADVVEAPNDKQQLRPMLDQVSALPETLGKADVPLADNGYFSEANVEARAAAGIDPLIAMGREPHHPSLAERFVDAPPAPDAPTPLKTMAHRLKTPEGKTLHGLRKHMPEPVFGIIKAALGFRQFLLRGLDHVRGEWSLVTMAWNMKRTFVLAVTH